MNLKPVKNGNGNKLLLSQNSNIFFHLVLFVWRYQALRERTHLLNCSRKAYDLLHWGEHCESIPDEYCREQGVFQLPAVSEQLLDASLANQGAGRPAPWSNYECDRKPTSNKYVGYVSSRTSVGFAILQVGSGSYLCTLLFFSAPAER